MLVLGFGPFLDVADNPAARLARAVDGATVGGRRVVGRVMPVSYSRGPELAASLAEDLDPELILGVGVARDRPEPWVERVGRRRCSATEADVDGTAGADLEPEGPEEVEASLDVDALAAALGCGVSRDAGRYVCNGWLYRAVRTLGAGRPVGFLHVPDAGLTPERLLRGLAALVGEPLPGG